MLVADHDNGCAEFVTERRWERYAYECRVAERACFQCATWFGAAVAIAPGRAALLASVLIVDDISGNPR